MTVSTEISSNEYTGNGVTTDFDYKFRIFKANQLSVITSDADGDNVVTLRLGTDYTVTGANKSAGGKVILTKPLANGHKISIARDIPITQETSFRNQSKFFAETHEDAFDYLTMILQRIWGSLGSLYLKRPNILANWFDAKGYRIANLGKPKRDSDAVDLGTLKDEIEGVNSTILKHEKRLLRVDDIDIAALPKASDRAGNVLTFDKDGKPIVVAPASGSAVDVLNRLAKDDGVELIGGFDTRSALTAGVIHALSFGVKSGVSNRALLQELQDLSEELRLPVNFSGVTEVVFDGHILIGNYFHWVGAGRNETIIKPSSLTRAEVGTNGRVYAWFQRKDPNSNMSFAMLEDMGFDGQYQDEYSTPVNRLIRGFCWHAHNGAKLTDITALRCDFRNMPHEAWEGYTTNGGTIDGIRYLFCSSSGDDPAKTAVGFNAFKCMNGSIDEPSEYGIYTIKNIVCFGSEAKGHRTLADFKRGCENWSISQCNTYDMNDCHHSTDGSRKGTINGVIGIQKGTAHRTKNFIEIQGEDIQVNDWQYDADEKNGTRKGNAGIFITNYQYPSLTGFNESKDIMVLNGVCKNVNSSAVRVINASGVSIDNLKAVNCVDAYSFNLAGEMEIPTGCSVGKVETEVCDAEFYADTRYRFLLKLPTTNKEGGSRIRGTITYPDIPTPWEPIFSSNNLNYDPLLKSIQSTSITDKPFGVPHAVELTDTNASDVTKFLIAEFTVGSHESIYVSLNCKRSTAASSAVLFIEMSNGVQTKFTYCETQAIDRWSLSKFAYRISDPNTDAIRVSLCPACNVSGDASLQGKTKFTNVMISKYPLSD